MGLQQEPTTMEIFIGPSTYPKLMKFGGGAIGLYMRVVEKFHNFPLTVMGLMDFTRWAKELGQKPIFLCPRLIRPNYLPN